jgi:uncharacterized membrane protein
MIFVNTILTVYIWVMVALLLFFLGAIAKFYANKAHQRSFHGLFILPTLLLVSGAFRYALIPTIVGDSGGDLARFSGGVILIGLGLFLLRRMVGSRS